MILNRKDWLALHAQAFVGAVEQRDMRDLNSGRKGVRQHGESVVLAGDLHLARGQVLDRVVGAAMSKMHFFRLPPKREREKLMTETNAEERNFAREQLLDRRNGIDSRRRRIARTVGEKDAVGLLPEDFL